MGAVKLVYFDLETERSAEEVGGWKNIEQLGLTVAVTCAAPGQDDNENQSQNQSGDAANSSTLLQWRVFRREDVAALLQELRAADCIIGFNTRGFDFRVLQPFADFDLKTLPNVDLMLDIKKAVGFRAGLDNCCGATLGQSKSGGGLEMLQLWREGRQQEVIDYCRQDVDLTRQLHEWGARHGHVKCLDRAGRLRTVPVSWSLAAAGAPPAAQQGTLF